MFIPRWTNTVPLLSTLKERREGRERERRSERRREGQREMERGGE
jgi:hypothetical protein